MTFYDIPENHLPSDAQYYFNVLAISIATDNAEDFPPGVDEIWYTDRLTEPEPHIYHFCLINNSKEEEEEENGIIEDLEIEVLPHQVVEIHPTLGVCLYDMIDFETGNLWRID